MDFVFLEIQYISKHGLAWQAMLHTLHLGFKPLFKLLLQKSNVNNTYKYINDIIYFKTFSVVFIAYVLIAFVTQWLRYTYPDQVIICTSPPVV